MQYRKSTTLSSCDNYFVSRFPVGIELVKNNRNGRLIIIIIEKLWVKCHKVLICFLSKVFDMFSGVKKASSLGRNDEFAAV